MAIALKFAGLVVIALALAAISVWWIGSQQPSRAIHQYERALVVAIKASDAATNPPWSLPDGTLWSGRAAHTLVGDEDAYWTHFWVMKAGSDIEPLLADPAVEDAYAAQVTLSNVPSFALGFLRAQHRLGWTKRPEADLENAFDQVSDRADIMPSQASLEATLALPPTQSVTMMNFLEYYPDDRGEKAKARKAYLRYGAEAMKAVHAVGGQLLFAGQVERVLVEAKGQATPGQWDDLAAMTYPDPGAIFSMEQNPDYVAALGDRDASLKRTHVIATVAD